MHSERFQKSGPQSLQASRFVLQTICSWKGSGNNPFVKGRLELSTRSKEPTRIHLSALLSIRGCWLLAQLLTCSHTKHENYVSRQIFWCISQAKGSANAFRRQATFDGSLPVWPGTFVQEFVATRPLHRSKVARIALSCSDKVAMP